MRGQRTLLGDRRAVLLAQPAAHVGVQRDVQRPQLFPEPVELLRKGVGRHVVLAAPHRAGVRERQRLRAFVRKLDEARVVLLHRHGDRVPPFPDLLQPLRVPAFRQEPGDRLDVEALLAGRALRAVLAAPVHALHRRDQARELVRLLRIRRRRHRQRVLQHVELAALGRRQRHGVEAARLLRIAGRGAHERGVRLGGDLLGIHGDVRALRPAGAVRRVHQAKQLAVGFLEKRAGRFRRRGRGRYLLLSRQHNGRSGKRERLEQASCQHDGFVAQKTSLIRGTSSPGPPTRSRLRQGSGEVSPKRLRREGGHSRDPMIPAPFAWLARGARSQAPSTLTRHDNRAPPRLNAVSPLD